MDKYFFVLLLLAYSNSISQNVLQINLIHRFSPSVQLEIQKLDSVYVSAVHVDKNQCAFPDKGDTVLACWKIFLQNISDTLKKKNYIWQNETKIFLRSYFNENGNIDYLMYNTRDTSFVRQKEFEDALQNFASSYNFGLKCDKKYVQCGNVIFGRKK